MKPLPLNRLLTLALALAALGPTAASADHIMVTPADLKWEDAKAIPPGAKRAVIEGPLNKAVPFTIRIKILSDYSLQPNQYPRRRQGRRHSAAVNLRPGHYH